MQCLALSMLQYTPNVALYQEHSIMLNVGASLSLFKGPRALLKHLHQTLKNMQISACSGMAPTALGAWILASQTRQALRHCLRLGTLQRRLQTLPVQALPAARPYAQWLDGLACHTLAQLRCLPRAGLQQRSQPQLLQQLDAAYGDVQLHFNWFQAPGTFAQRMDLDEKLEYSQALLIYAGRLIEQLCGWLQAQQKATRLLEFHLHHEKGRHAQPPTPLLMQLSDLAWMPSDFYSVLKEQLNTFSLPAGVIAMQLFVNDISDRPAISAGLFPEPTQWLRQEHRLLDLLRARLGHDAVLQAQPIADYRPERANCWVPVTDAHAQTPRLPPLLPVHTRPFWLLPAPVALQTINHRPVYLGSPLRLIQGPERLETGWWGAAGHERRDYFIARHRHGSYYWIYRQRETPASGWFLHGLFA
ncbi:hypothetical protein PT7_1214 [Pusillimonas sp. T7-7]|nr:hypothetical protein PT7_1214 [Pusillimonas sp. T7-7]